MLRPNASACALFVALSLVVGARTAIAGGGPQLLRGPYLQQGTPTGIIIRWRTDIGVNSRVIYGDAVELTGGPSELPQPGSLTASSDDPTLTTEHEITLTGLAPNTRYYYAVGQFSGAGFELLSGGDADHFFDTPPSAGTPKPVRIWVLGDSGQANLAVQNVRDAYRDFTNDLANGGANARHTELWLMLGDNAYPQGTDAQYQTALFDIFGEMARKSVLWPTIGNHDLFDLWGSWPYGQIFNLPKNAEAGGVASTSEKYYSFDYANIHFVVLDSATYPPGTLAGSAQLTWLVADLLDTSQEWIVVFFHHPPYSKGAHDSDDAADSNGRLVDMRTLVVPLLEDHGVDLVLAGHSHSYERSFLIDGHHGNSSTFDPQIHGIDTGDGDPASDGAYQSEGPGAVFGVAGNASHLTPGKAEVLNGGAGVDPYPAMSTSLYELGSMVLDFNGNRLDGILLDDSGATLDRFTLIKGAPPLPPAADFSVQPSNGSVGEALQFTDQSTNAPSVWNWDCDGDGEIDSVEPDPSFVYELPGSYSVSLAVSNYAGADALTRDDYVCITDGVPGAITGLALHGDRITMSWDPDPRAETYDVVKGDLTKLVATGDWKGALLGCVTAATDLPTTTDDQLPTTGQALFYLARGANCLPETGTFDGPGPAQHEPRDLALQGSGGCACAVGDDDDSDFYCNAYDNCPETGGENLGDEDDDGFGDICDPCPGDTINDGDGDGVCEVSDNCPGLDNPDQQDYDGDLVGDACDPDIDGDGVENGEDGDALDELVCRDVDLDGCDDCASGSDDPLSDGVDIDADGLCDSGDDCVDVDGDGVGNGSAGNVGCLIPASDADDFDATSCADVDDDGCDDCAPGGFDPSDDGPDPDSDGICDATDNCSGTVNADQADTDGDGAGDVCDGCTDTDGDAYGNPGFPANQCDPDNCPDQANPLQEDRDGDLAGDVCDTCTDVDHDGYGNPGFPDPACPPDNCPDVSNDQQDFDADGIGDVCDGCTDGDKDGYGNPAFPNTECAADNCPGVPNPGQDNYDGDAEGDVCDLDDDNDTVPDVLDQDDFDPFACFDLDGDSCDDCASGANDPANDGSDADADGACDAGDGCPLDPDNDRDSDLVCGNTDNCPGLPNPDQEDDDLDGIGDVCRYIAVSSFYIAAVEVTNAEYATFLDAVAPTDPAGLYNTMMAGDPRGGILRSGFPGSFSYEPKPNMTMKPVNFVSWLDAARYANWQHNGRPTGPQSPLTTEDGAYDLGVSNPGRNATREPGAHWFLPDENEWGEAAYADPAAGVSWLFPTRTNALPLPALATTVGAVANPGFNVANYLNGADWNGLNGNVTDVGGAGPLSTSPFMTYDQGGNVAEWVETAYPDGERRLRGGAYNDSAQKLRRTSVVTELYDRERAEIGFRIAAALGCPDDDEDGYGLPWVPGCLGTGPDNCPDDANPSQADLDDDGLGDACDDSDDDGVNDESDCAPLAAGVAGPPDPIGPTLRLSRGGSVTLHWLRSFQGHTTNVYSVTQLAGHGAVGPMTCLAAENPATMTTDSTLLLTGTVSYYLLAARNSCGESTLAHPVTLCGNPGNDTDADTVPDLADNCPLAANVTQSDGDDDFVGDTCDNCDAVPNPDQADGDADGTGDACE